MDERVLRRLQLLIHIHNNLQSVYTTNQKFEVSMLTETSFIG